MTDAIPDGEDGEMVRDYKTAFKTDILPVNNSKVTISLTKDPVFIEGIE